jgi:hypothetical protein
MAHTDDDAVVALAIRDIIEANKATLQLNDVFYGNHTMIPNNSAAVVMAMGKRRQLAGVSAPGGRTQNDLLVTIQLHWSRVGNEEPERRACDARGTAVERLLHANVTLDGIIIHGYVSEVDRGETLINNSMFRSVMMTYVGITKTYLSPPAAPS